MKLPDETAKRRFIVLIFYCIVAMALLTYALGAIGFFAGLTFTFAIILSIPRDGNI